MYREMGCLEFNQRVFGYNRYKNATSLQSLDNEANLVGVTRITQVRCDYVNVTEVHALSIIIYNVINKL